jgi:hypothetical protein
MRTAYLEARFASFVFPDEDAVSSARPGPHDEGEREAARQRLIREAALKLRRNGSTGRAGARRSRFCLPPGTSVAASVPAAAPTRIIHERQFARGGRACRSHPPGFDRAVRE